MLQIKSFCKKIVLIIITISILISFCATPSAYAKLELKEGEFYYAGTQKGQYTVTQGIFSWILDKIGDIADWILGIITMGFRMVFVGWTALLEKLLTWALESASGVNVNGDIIESNTDLTSITDSSNNVTIEAIVYNHVAALDANMFRYEKTIDDLKYTGTGHLLKCEDPECNVDPTDDVTKCCNEDGECTCGCGSETHKCDACMTYCNAVKKFNENNEAPAGEREDSVIVQIKKSAAMWYYIIRTISIAAMLVLLIGIGIKMAFSNIADKKALYKRMLVDWVVGMIILFSMHYIMIFVFYINESLVHIIEDTANNIYKVQMMQLAEKNSNDGVEYSDEELELKVYETVRTRAYDAKLLNGLSGTIMYMTLVYFAYRYTIIYIKRFFTIMVLTIMSPAVGFGYAMQKSLTGKQAVMKTWISEYILNTIIQVVHALTYAIFISQALVMSLDSVAGVIIALILMNFTLKAESLFRKIFKITGGLVEKTDSAAENFKQNIQSTVIGGRSAVKTLTNTPYMTAVKGAGKVALTGIGLGATGLVAAGNAVTSRAQRGSSALRDSFNNRFGRDSSEDAEPENMPNPSGSGTETNPQVENTGAENEEKSEAGNASSRDRANNSQMPIRTDDELLNDGEKQLEENLNGAKEAVANAKTPEEKKEANKKLVIAVGEYNRFRTLTEPTNLDILKAHGKRLIGIKNIFTVTSSTNGAHFKKDVLGDIFGHTYLDKRTGKKVNDGTGYYNQFRAKNLFGLTDDDKKLLKQQLGVTAGTITGMASLFLGMGTLVANPKLGLGLLANGGVLTHRGLGRSTKISSYKGRYKFSRFSIPSLKAINNKALELASKEYNSMVTETIRKDNSGLYDSLKADTIVARTLKGTFKAVLLPGKILTAPGAKFMQGTNIGVQFNELNYYLAKKHKKQKKEFGEEALRVINSEILAEFELRKERFDKEQDDTEEAYKIAIYAALGYIYDPITKTLKSSEPLDVDEEAKEQFENELDSRMRNNRVDDDISDSLKLKYKKGTEIEITQEMRNTISREIDDILVSMSAGEVLDMNSEANLDTAIDKLNERLYQKGYINKKQSSAVLFKGGKQNLISTLKEKAELVNIKVEIATQALEDIEEEDREIIKQTIKEIAQEETVEDFTKIEIEEVIKRVDSKKTDMQNQQPTSDSGNNTEALDSENSAEDSDFSSDDGSNPDATSSSSENGSNASNADATNKRRKRIDQMSIDDKTKKKLKLSADEMKDLYGKLNNDGLQDISKTVKVHMPLSQAQVAEYTPKIEEFLKSLEIAKVVTHDEKYQKKIKAREMANYKAKNRKKKLKQILDITLDSEQDDPTSDLIDKVKDIKATGGNIKGKNGSEIELTSEESNSVLEMLFLRKELQKINSLAKEELELKNGSYNYTKAVKAKSDNTVEYYSSNLKVKRFIQENPELYYDNDYKSKTNKYTKEEIREKNNIIELENTLDEKRKKMEKAKREVQLRGPIVDINEVQQQLFKNDK